MKKKIDAIALNFEWSNKSKIRSLDITPKSNLQEIVDYFRYTLMFQQHLYFFKDEECKEQITELKIPIIQLGVNKVYCKKSRIELVQQNGQQRFKMQILINNIKQKEIELIAGCHYEDLINQKDINNILQEYSFYQIVISNNQNQKIDNEQIHTFNCHAQPYYFNIIIERENNFQQQYQKDQKQSQKSISYSEESTKSSIEEWKKITLQSDHLIWKQQNGTELKQLIISVDTKKKVSDFKMKMKKHGIISFEFNMGIYCNNQFIIMDNNNILDYYHLDNDTIIYIEKI